MKVTASIVLYRTSQDEVRNIVASLTNCELLSKIHLVDNSPEQSWEQADFPERVKYCFVGKNIGFGRGHNVALRAVLNDSDFHLVTNSDINFEPGVIERLAEIMADDPTIGAVGPHVKFENGETQRGCKLLPHPLDVLGRRFFSHASWARRRNALYELAMFDYARPANIPFLSGCFLLLRTAALREVGLFDERYFLYAEDIDLSRRIHTRFVTRYEPSVSITHQWRRMSHHSLKGTLIALRSHAQYFNKWGWLHDPERDAINHRALTELGIYK